MKTIRLLLPVAGLALLAGALAVPKGESPRPRESRGAQAVASPVTVRLVTPDRRPAAPIVPPTVETEFDWHDGVRSADPEERSAAVAVLQLRPGEDGAEVLRGLALTDPSDRVRQRAVLALAQVLGREAVPFLRKIALGDRPLDGAAALASLDLIEQLHPRAPRGRVDLVSAHDFSPGGVAEFVARIQCDEDVRSARLGWRVPHGWEVIGDALWNGPLAAGETREVRLRLQVPSTPTEGRLVARLKCEFEEPLDLEVATDAFLLSVGDGRAGAQEPGASIVKAIDVSDAE